MKLLVESIGHIIVEDGHTFKIIPKNNEAILVSESLDDNLSIDVLVFLHRNTTIEEKKIILIKFAKYFESKKDNLRELDNRLEKNLFFSFNKLNIRHNNEAENNHEKNAKILKKINKDKLNELYDCVYRECLLAFHLLEYDVEDRKTIEEIRKKFDK